jgi:ureidoacrylate peracid hydrolase
MALLVIDMNREVASEQGQLVRHLRAEGVSTEYYLEQILAITPNINRLAETIRANGGLVVWIRPEFRRPAAGDWPVGYREQVARGGFRDVSHEGTENYPLLSELAVDDDDFQVAKSSVSAFWGANLRSTLVNCCIDHVVIVGALTNSSVLITAIDANNNSLHPTIVDDACVALDPEDHRSSLNLMSLMYEQATTDEVIERVERTLSQLARDAAE